MEEEFDVEEALKRLSKKLGVTEERRQEISRLVEILKKRHNIDEVIKGLADESDQVLRESLDIGEYWSIG
jgi:hypothetical protein